MQKEPLYKQRFLICLLLNNSKNYSLTAAAPSPVVIAFCERMKKITNGILITNAPAANVVN